jgi:hypothetical protein
MHKTRSLTLHTGTQCQGAYAFEKFISQELSSRVGKNTEFIFLQLEGEIDEDIIENINACGTILWCAIVFFCRVIFDNFLYLFVLKVV